MANLFDSKKSNRRSNNFPSKTLEGNQEKIEEILAPFVDEGKNIRDQIIQLESEGKLSLTPFEISELQKMEDAELAGFAYFATSQGAHKAIKKKDLIDCISVSLGFSTISGIYGILDGTAAMISAKTAWAIGKAFIGRTLGWIGVAIAIYDYADCLRSKGAFK